MRKNIKKTIMNIFQSIHEAHKLANNYIKSNDFISLKFILSECVKTSSDIIEFIKNNEKNDCKAVLELEKYIVKAGEFLQNLDTSYDISQNKDKTSIRKSCETESLHDLSAKDVIKQLDKQLRQAEKSISNIKTTYEIVFMPYKASMWDSLASVYEAAAADKDCEAYIVPVPYFERNSDGEFDKVNYEIDLFPKSANLISYEKYDFQARRPDAIYIHNPYDEYNYVTRVYPKFYSGELKKYTDCLVYIPYCIHDEPGSMTEKEKYNFYCKYALPVMLNADKLIFQSESLKQAMTEAFKKDILDDDSYWDNKAIGLGSPKIDAIYKEYDFENIPNRWKSKILRADNSKKTVIFYNTTISLFLKHNEVMLEKIKYTLEFFKKNIDNYTLIWRPHPLIKATIRSMRPYLYEEYEKIVNQYNHDDYGIFDETPDYHTALALSDAYYGDYSSISKLYLNTHKPLLIQTPAVLKDEKHLYMVESIYADSQSIWISSNEFNALYRISLCDMKAEYIGSFIDEENECQSLYTRVVEHKDKLYFCPYNAKTIGIYDKKEKRFSKIDLPAKIANRQEKFTCIEVLADKLYLQGKSVDGIVVVDLSNLSLNLIDPLSVFKREKSKYYITSSCKSGNIIYYYVPKLGIVRFDVQSFTCEKIYETKQLPDRTFMILKDNKIWLMQKPGGFISYFDIVKREYKNITELKEPSCFVSCGSHIYYFTFDDNVAYNVSTDTCEINTIDIPCPMYSAVVVKNKIYMIAYEKMSAYLLDIDSKEIKGYPITLGACQYPHIDKTKLFDESKAYNSGIAGETSFLDLPVLANIASESKDLLKNKTKHSKSNGKKIHEYIKRCLVKKL